MLYRRIEVLIESHLLSNSNYTVHSALNALAKNEDYHIKKAFVLSNAREITANDKIIYIPIYYIMFFQNAAGDSKNLQL